MRRAPSINSGSMADIAFLLLIFFLVTTTVADDVGFYRKLPDPCPVGQDCTADLKTRNVLRILLNNDQQIMVNDQLVELGELKDMAMAFVDNNGNGTCSYCTGDRLMTSSEHPTKAVISLQSGQQTTYELFIKIQDEITKAYYQLRENYTLRQLNKSLKQLTREELKIVRDAYPFILSEAQIQ